MKENDLIECFYKYNQQRYEMIAQNVYPCFNFKEMDVMAIRKSGFIDEIEVKLSKSDFLADFKKTVNIKCDEVNKHKCLHEGLSHCNYFSFLMTEELAKKCEIPEYSGLYVFNGRRVKEVKKPKKLHSRKISIELKYQIAKKMAFRFWQSKNIFNKR